MRDFLHKDGEQQKPKLAPYRSMFLGLNKCDKFMYIIAIIFATLNGCGMAMNAVFFANLIDSFNPNSQKSEIVGTS